MAVTTAPAPPLGAEYTFAAILIIILLVLSVAAEKRHIPSSAVLIMLGAAVGAILWPTGLDAHLGLAPSPSSTSRCSCIFCSRQSSSRRASA